MHLSLHVLVVLQCTVFRVFCPVLLSFSVFPLSPHLLLLLLFISIIAVLISSLNSQFSMMGALAGAGCGWVVSTGLLIFRGKKSKISRDFQGQIRGKISRFHGIFAGKKSKFAEQSADFAGF